LLFTMPRCAYDVKNNKVQDEQTVFIKPDNMPALNEETVKKTGVSQKEIDEKGVSFSEAIQKVSPIRAISASSLSSFSRPF